jgi:hypothetical protein
LHDNHKATRFKNTGKLLNRVFGCNIRTQLLEGRDRHKRKVSKRLDLLLEILQNLTTMTNFKGILYDL